MKRIRRFLTGLSLLATMIVLFGAAGCAQDVPTGTTGPEEQSPPAISYINMSISERNGETVTADVNFYVNMLEYEYTAPSHVIYYYDEEPPTDPTQTAYTAPGTYIIQKELAKSAAWKDVPPGTHLFAVQVVTVDDKPFNPPVTVKTLINIPPSGPEIRILSINFGLPLPEYIQEATPEAIPPILVQIESASHNFKLSDDNIGKENVSGEGHYIYYLDTEPPTDIGQSAVPKNGEYKVTTEEFYIWEEIPSGLHTFSVQLVNNDNTPLDPPVFATITVTLPSVL
jgi:hypothetical protein